MNWKEWVALLIFFKVYLLFGGVVFMLIESPEEEVRLQELNGLKTVIHGYGHLAPSTPSGRVFCIFFALFGIPLNGILFATLGNYFGSKLVKRPNKRKRGRVATFIVITAEILLYSIPGLIVFLAIPAGLFTIVEGWDYVDSFYYAFVTLTTIGFGDLVAGQHDIGQWTWVYRSFIIIWILFGLGYLIMVINIITKGLRSNPVVAPVIALEKRMAARIRATRHLLAKDGVALRQLVHDIRVMKAKPVPRQARMELLRTFSHPVLRYEEPHIEKDPEKLNEATGSDGLNNAGIHYIDRGITCNNGSFRKPMERMESIEDPLQLLTRLATVLCNDDQENDLSIPEISISEVEHSQENRDICKESAFDRIRRSLRLSRNRSGEEPPCPPFSSNVQRGSQTGNVNRIRTDRRVRHVSESHSQTITDCSGSMKSHRQLIIEQERKPASEFRRSRSEKFAPNKGASISSLSDTPSLDWSHQSKKDLLVGAICNTDNAARTGSPTIAAVKLCDMLDRVQISRQSTRASPKN
ncbi:hypothetical protein GHT06_013230 [Daphnia sinensis]|uniref:Potassium channel domain-containing protein n=1 Tax=Daphnia sinensis TaxID=1820382 RepID=A0AAD5LHR9_9CRUS|nr:hypothetical protein GHT06_013230 [Daphnia sinensis]